MKFLGLIVFIAFASLGGAWTAFRGIRASDAELCRMASLIGTRRPRLARAVCWVAFVILTMVGGGMVVPCLLYFVRWAIGTPGDLLDDLPAALVGSATLVVAGVAYIIAYPADRPPDTDPHEEVRPLLYAEEIEED